MTKPEPTLLFRYVRPDRREPECSQECVLCGKRFRRANASHGFMHERRGEATAMLNAYARDRWCFYALRASPPAPTGDAK